MKYTHLHDEKLEKICETYQGLVRANVPLAPFTTFKVGGPAKLFAELASQADLIQIYDLVSTYQVPILVIGNGSNLLVSDTGFRGLVLHLTGSFAEAKVLSETTIEFGSAMSLPVAARKSAQLSLTGLEWAVGVPGTVGGAVVMNAGGHGSQVSNTLSAIDVVSLNPLCKNFGNVVAQDVTELALSYRSSNLESSDLVLAARFKLEPGDSTKSLETIREIVAWRRANQPGGQNCGSVFTNPQGAGNEFSESPSAGELIERAGLKGARVGRAQISSKHANFIQADPGCLAGDVLALIGEVQDAVKERFSIWLEPEVKMAGFEDPKDY